MIKLLFYVLYIKIGEKIFLLILLELYIIATFIDG